jgi:hypothetical protein
MYWSVLIGKSLWRLKGRTGSALAVATNRSVAPTDAKDENLIAKSVYGYEADG